MLSLPFGGVERLTGPQAFPGAPGEVMFKAKKERAHSSSPFVWFLGPARNQPSVGSHRKGAPAASLLLPPQPPVSSVWAPSSLRLQTLFYFWLLKSEKTFSDSQRLPVGKDLRYYLHDFLSCGLPSSIHSTNIEYLLCTCQALYVALKNRTFLPVAHGETPGSKFPSV